MPRGDVAHVVADVVEDASTTGRTLRFNHGDTEIGSFLQAAQD